MATTSSKSVAVVATSDESPMLRKMAPLTAVTIAEHYRDQGDNVLLIIDSVTRFAHAIREVATASGEPPIARGYPASVFTELPRLLERAGPGAEGAGTITAIISILVDGDNHNDPIADSTRGILDGHIVMERSLAEEGRYPPVNPLASISRLARKAWTPDQEKLVARLKSLIHRFEETRDLRLIGGYRAGQRSGPRHGDQAGAGHLRHLETDAGRAAGLGCVHRPCKCAEGGGEHGGQAQNVRRG